MSVGMVVGIRCSNGVFLCRWVDPLSAVVCDWWEILLKKNLFQLTKSIGLQFHYDYSVIKWFDFPFAISRQEQTTLFNDIEWSVHWTTLCSCDVACWTILNLNSSCISNWSVKNNFHVKLSLANYAVHYSDCKCLPHNASIIRTQYHPISSATTDMKSSNHRTNKMTNGNMSAVSL